MSDLIATQATINAVLALSAVPPSVSIFYLLWKNARFDKTSKVSAINYFLRLIATIFAVSGIVNGLLAVRVLHSFPFEIFGFSHAEVFGFRSIGFNVLVFIGSWSFFWLEYYLRTRQR